MPHVEERRRVGSRISALRYLITVLFSVLAISFWILQVVEHAKFEEMAENNHQRTLPLRAPRGVVFDRDGRVLVENRHSFSISIAREHTRDMNRTIRLLAEVLNVDEARIREVVDRHRREPSYRPITVVQDATLAQVAAVTARRLDFELPDIVVEPVPTRQLSRPNWRRISSDTSARSTTRRLPRTEGLKSGDIVGQSGIEKVYNALLMGEDGAKRVVVNSVGREIRTLEEVPSRSKGKRLQITIDADVQKAVEDAFKARRFNGAAVVLDPKNGEVLGFTSLPAYDPNAFATGSTGRPGRRSTRDELRPLQRPRHPGALLTRVDVQDGGRDRPALEEGVITPDFQRQLRAATPISTAATSSAGRRAATAPSICATRSNSRATCTSTPSAT